MTDPIQSDSHPTNGRRPTNEAKLPHPLGSEEADLAAKLPQAPPPRPIETLSPGMRRDARRAFLILLTTGLILGAVTATGVVWVMNQLNLIGVPAQPDSE